MSGNLSKHLSVHFMPKTVCFPPDIIFLMTQISAVSKTLKAYRRIPLLYLICVRVHQAALNLWNVCPFSVYHSFVHLSTKQKIIYSIYFFFQKKWISIQKTKFFLISRDYPSLRYMERCFHIKNSANA